jgi:hypothetical protein
MKKDKWKKKNKTFCPGCAYEPGKKVLQPKPLHRSHVMDYMSRLLSGPGQKVEPFVLPPLSRLASQDKSFSRAGIIDLFSTSERGKIANDKRNH